MFFDKKTIRLKNVETALLCYSDALSHEAKSNAEKASKKKIKFLNIIKNDYKEILKDYVKIYCENYGSQELMSLLNKKEKGFEEEKKKNPTFESFYLDAIKDAKSMVPKNGLEHSREER